MKYNFCTYGHPVLRQPAEPVARVDGPVRELARDMLAIMRERRGVGLAAQQIGLTCQVCTVGFDPGLDVAEPGGPRLNPEIALPLVLINPLIRSRSGAHTDTEGCLSVPDVWAPVARAWEIEIEFLDLQADRQAFRVRGLLARALQHELDHLRGVLFVDRLGAARKITLAGKLKRLQRKTQLALATAGGPPTA